MLVSYIKDNKAKEKVRSEVEVLPAIRYFKGFMDKCFDIENQEKGIFKRRK